MAKPLPHGKLCCCVSPGCLIAFDLFNRADSNPPTGRWSVIDVGTLQGEWEIIDNTLRSIEDGPIITTHRQPAPVRTGNGYNSRIVVDLVIPASGNASYGIITAYRGTDDYSWVKLDYNGGTGELTPTFYDSPTNIVMDITTHPGEEIWTPSPGTNFTMEICSSHVEWTVTNAGLQGDVIWHRCEGTELDALPPPPLGGVGFLFGHFDNWYYYIHWESDSACQKCQCFCLNPLDINDYSCIPDHLILTLTPDQMDPDCGLDGMELNMYLTNPDASGPTPVFNPSSNRKRWYSETFTCEGETLWFILTCDNDFARTISLVPYPNLDPEDGTGNNVFLAGGQTRILPDVEECNPFYLEYQSAVDTGLTTCDLLDEFGVPIGTGVRPLCCTGCWNEEDVPTPTWTITITAAP